MDGAAEAAGYIIERKRLDKTFYYNGERSWHADPTKAKTYCSREAHEVLTEYWKYLATLPEAKEEHEIAGQFRIIPAKAPE